LGIPVYDPDSEKVEIPKQNEKSTLPRFTIKVKYRSDCCTPPPVSN
jgi:hypothetical protein